MQKQRVLVGLSGPRGCGKSTAGEILRAAHGFVPLAFADPIRAAVQSAFGWPAEAFDPPRKDAICPLYGVSPRAMLRAFGEHTRSVCPGAYIGYMADRVAALSPTTRVVITDVRTPEEAAWVRAHGVLAHVQRPLHDWSGEHPTEMGPGRDPGDLTLHNPGSPEGYAAMCEVLAGVVHWGAAMGLPPRPRRAGRRT